MAWTTPRTWTAGETVTATIMNSAIRDNENLLKTRIADTGMPCLQYYGSISSVATTGSTETTLASFTLPANELVAGDRIWFRATAVLAATTNLKTVTAYMGTNSVAIFSETLNYATNYSIMDYIITATSDAAATCEGFATWGVYSSGMTYTLPGAFAGGAHSLAAETTVKITGTGVANNDITLYRPLFVLLRGTT